MKSILLIILLSIYFNPIYSQNLVSNGSFESTNECLIKLSQFYKVNSWYTQYSILTPDVFNPCDTVVIPFASQNVGVPNNEFGYQFSSTKKNYAGIYVSSRVKTPNPLNCSYYQEVLSIKLKQTLDSGIIYSFNLMLSVANTSNMFFDGLGVCITSDSLIVSQNPQATFINSHLATFSQKNNGFLMDTLKWIKFGGNYTANGSESFLHIADFDSIKSAADFLFFGLQPKHGFFYTDFPGSYYHIDDVALWRADDSTYISCDIGQTDTAICYGDSILLGAHHYIETYYRWQHITHSGQNIKSKIIYDSGFVWVKPTKTTTYILETTNCIFEKTYDTVVVTVQKCGPNAGMDTAVCKNSTLVLGGIDNIGYNCQWYPNTFLSSDTAAMPTMTATQSMMYYLSISDATGVIKTDSIYVIAGDCYYSVEVRDDTLICKGDTVHLGKHNYAGAQYEWTPNWLLNNNTIANPYCLADTTILYTLKLTDIVGNISYDSVLVGVTICPGFEEIKGKNLMAKVYPNPAKEQITFELSDYSISDYEIRIFNSMGAIVYNGSFNGTIKKVNTSKFKNGIYFYRIVDSKNRSMLGKFIVF